MGQVSRPTARQQSLLISKPHNRFVPLYRDEAVVLRTHKLGEADRIVSLLTLRHGQVRAVAKGVRRTKSHFGARLEPFMHVDLQLNEGRNLDMVIQAVTLGAYAGSIMADYELYTTAMAMVEAAEKLTEVEREPAAQQFLLLNGGLYALAERRHAPSAVLDSYLLRALAIAGYAPSFTDCAQCGRPGPHSAFSIRSGGAVCVDCRPLGSASPTPQAMDLLGALLVGNWSSVDGVASRYLTEAAGLTAAYVQWYLERRVRSLRLVEAV